MYLKKILDLLKIPTVSRIKAHSTIFITPAIKKRNPTMISDFAKALI
jgi:hypothetical protein